MVCPCLEFSSEEAIISAIESEADTAKLVAWLRGKAIDADDDEPMLSPKVPRNTCEAAANGGRCPRRVGAAFVVLNAVRDGCRRHLDVSPSSSTSASNGSSSGVGAAALASVSIPNRSEPSFESSFPSLQSMPSKMTTTKTAANVLVGRKKKKQQQPKHPPSNHPHANNFPVPKSGDWAGAARSKAEKPTAVKRRIRPVPAAGSSISPWVSSSLSEAEQFPALKGNISSLPSEDPALARKLPQQPGFTKRIESKHPREKVGLPKYTGWGKKPAVEPLTMVGSGGGEGRCVKENLERTGVEGTTNAKPSAGAAKCDNDPVVFGRLVDTYAAVIQSLLAPSIPLELHLLIRMLAVDVGAAPSDASDVDGIDDMTSFKRIFSSRRSCRVFSCDVLSRLRSLLLNLGHEMIKALLALPVMVVNLPEIARGLRGVLENGSKEQIVVCSHLMGSDTLQLTVPFDQTRDSRHNYRSKDQTMLFTNREESRDKFMYQLRAFQEIRGTVVDPSQADMYIDEIKKSCREMVQGLLPGNMFWFAEFFCDLLLQIGLIPMEETDKEIVKNVDKERLKKLHRRFTSKGSQKSKSSQKLSLDRKNQALASSSTAQGHFSGHQEFFYLFLFSVDSYQFGVQLRRRLAGLIANMSAIEETKYLEERVSKLQLLAKFLGMLVFSPNWSTAYEDPWRSTNLAMSTASEDALSQLNCTIPIIPLRQYIEDAWKECRLLVVVPWVVDFLRMAMWDNVSVEATYYQAVFSLLRTIQQRLRQNLHMFEKHTPFCSNMQLISFQLESIFSDVVGLSKSEMLPLLTLPTREQEQGSDSKGPNDMPNRHECSNLDAIPFCFSKSFLFAASPHLEELHKLVIDLAHKKRGTFGGTGTPKKLRPYAISSDTANDATNRVLFPPPPTLALAANDHGRKVGTHLLGRSDGGIRTKLVDTFFHQHKELHELCEFLAGWSVRNATSTLVRDCIVPALDSKASVTAALDVASYVELIRGMEEEVRTSASRLMGEKAAAYIGESMRVLCPPSTNPRVRDIATALAIQYCQQSGDAFVDGMVRLEVQRRIDLVEKKESKCSAAKKGAKPQNRPAVRSPQPMENSEPMKTSHVRAYLDSASSALEKLASSPEKMFLSIFDENIVVLTNASSHIGQVREMNRGLESDSNDNESVKLFGSRLMTLLSALFRKKSKECAHFPPLLLTSFSIVVGLRRMGFVLRELIEVCVYVTEPRRLTVLVDWCDCKVQSNNAPENEHQSTLEGVGTMLVDMVDARLISGRTLESSLLGALEHHEEGQQLESLCQFCVYRLCSGNDDGQEWSDERALAMPRLRKVLMHREGGDSSGDTDKGID